MSVEKTLKIAGMTCGHCVASVTKELEKLPGAAEISIDLASATAHLKADNSVSDADLAAAISEAGYQLVSAS